VLSEDVERPPAALVVPHQCDERDRCSELRRGHRLVRALAAVLRLLVGVAEDALSLARYRLDTQHESLRMRADDYDGTALSGQDKRRSVA
jgi:hypothetical protein